MSVINCAISTGSEWPGHCIAPPGLLNVWIQRTDCDILIATTILQRSSRMLTREHMYTAKMVWISRTNQRSPQITQKPFRADTPQEYDAHFTYNHTLPLSLGLGKFVFTIQDATSVIRDFPFQIDMLQPRRNIKHGMYMCLR